jgi:hypothetical protein
MENKKNTEWAELFLQNSKNLTVPYLMENGFDNSFFNEQDLLEVLKSASNQSWKEISNRIYIGNGFSHEYSVKVHENPPKQGESMEKMGCENFW